MCVRTGLAGAEVSRKAPASERTCCGACWIASSASPGTTTCWVDRHSESTCFSGRIGNNTEIRFFARKFISLYRNTSLGTFTKDGQKTEFLNSCRISLKTLNSCLFSTLAPSHSRRHSHSSSSCSSSYIVGRIGCQIRNSGIQFFARKFISLYRNTSLGTFTKDGQKTEFLNSCRISLKL